MCITKITPQYILQTAVGSGVLDNCAVNTTARCVSM